MTIFEAIEKLAPILSFSASVAIFIIGYLLQNKARKIQILMAWNSHREPIKKFADEAIDVLTKVEGLCEVNPQINHHEYFNKYNEYITQISSLRDRGKLLLPNDFRNSHGVTKSSAYRGIRQKALDCLKAAFYIAVAINFEEAANNKTKASLKDDIKNNVQMQKLKAALSELPSGFKLEGHKNEGWSCKAGIVEAKRQFVSECQNLIDPEKWNKKIAHIIREH